MLRVFSGSCLSLEDMETVRRPNLVKRPHLLGPGVDFFTEDGEPVRPQPCAHTLQKVFSGSALDLNALNGDVLSEDEANHAGHAQESDQHPLPGVTVSTILNQISSETEKERAKSAKKKTIVLVIGGIGYIPSHVVKKLLDAGYTVRITVSDTMTQQQQTDLYSMSNDLDQRMCVFEVDMTNSATLRDALRGCKYVIHCGLSANNGSADLFKQHMAAAQALFDAIRLLGKSTVKRVVITGAASSVFHITDPDPPSGAFDESHWNTTANAKTDAVPFARISFEREAWRLQQMFGVELVVILPSITIGPSRTEEISDAMIRLQELAKASPAFPYLPNVYWNFVDVRDVAEAHVRALECAEVKDQRIIVSKGCYSYTDLSKMIKEAYPHLTPPVRTVNKFFALLFGIMDSKVKIGFLWRTLGVRKELDTTRATTELDMQFTPMEETIRACIDQLIRAGEVPAANAPPAKVSNSYFGFFACATLAFGAAATAAWAVARARRK